MGWFYDDLPDHEGYCVGYTLKLHDDRTPIAGVFRELGYPERDEQPIDKMGAACDCGWRSMRWRPKVWHDDEGKFHRPDYSPYTVWVSPDDEEMARGLWTEHVRDIHDLPFALRRLGAHGLAAASRGRG